MVEKFKGKFLSERKSLLENGLSRYGATVIAGIRVCNEMSWEQNIKEEGTGIEDKDFWKEMGEIEKILMKHSEDATKEENIKCRNN